MNTIFIILLIIFIIPYIVRFLAPYIMKYFFKKVQKNMENNMNQANNNFNQQDFNSNTANTEQEAAPNPAKEELGDYVEFEEIKEETNKP